MEDFNENHNSADDYAQYGGYGDTCPSDDEGDESAALYYGSMAPSDNEEPEEQETDGNCEESGSPETA